MSSFLPCVLRACLAATLLCAVVPQTILSQDRPSRAPADSAAEHDRSAVRRDTSRIRRDTLRTRSLDTVTVRGRVDDLIGTASTASEGRVGAADLSSRPITREGELLETVPGLIVTQHSGEGKANQYFVRGFNLDHGTDFQTRIEGMPLNMPSHGHGQGWTDLNFRASERVT